MRYRDRHIVVMKEAKAIKGGGRRRKAAVSIRRFKLALAGLAMTMVMVASAAPAMASHNSIDGW